MELRQLEYVVAVADTGGFTRAARTMHVSQPSLSHGVRTLEAELGIEIFLRLGRSVVLTPAGEPIVDAARRVLGAMTAVRTSAAAAIGLLDGRLDLVALPTLAVDPVASLIGRFRALHPAVSVRLIEPEDAQTLESEITSGRAEVGFSDITLSGRGLRRIRLYDQELLVVCPPGRAAGLDSLTPADLAAMPLIATPTGTSTRRLLDLVLAKTSHSGEFSVELHQREAILPLVIAGAGAALLPTAIAEQARTRGAAVRPMRPPVTRRVGLLHRDGALSPAARAFVELARADAAERRRAPA